MANKQIGGGQKMEHWQLKQLKSLPLEVKIEKSKLRIREWYEHYQGQVYVSFSGGKDSTVLLHLVRSLYPEVVAVFADTGLEFPEIKEFAKSVDNVDWLRPDISFRQVIEKFGYPVIGKDVSNCIEGARKGQKYRLDRLDGSIKSPDGGKSRYDNSKYSYLLKAPFKISEKCCNEMKKKPFKKYEKKTGKKGYVGTMTEESQLRVQKWIRTGCNAFEDKRPLSAPLSFWTEEDIWQYIKLNNVRYSRIYDMGYARTGCVFCMFGLQHDGYPNRFQRLQKTHNKLYEYCLKEFDSGGLGLKNVLDFLNIEYQDNQISFDDLNG